MLDAKDSKNNDKLFILKKELLSVSSIQSDETQSASFLIIIHFRFHNQFELWN